MRRVPPELLKTGEHEGNWLAARFDASRTACLVDTKMLIVLLYGHCDDRQTVALRIRVLGSIDFLRCAKVIGDSKWSPGYIAAEICRWCAGAEIVPVPDPDEFFGRDPAYAERLHAEYGVLAWNLAAGTCEGWGEGVRDTFGDSGVDIFKAKPAKEYKHGEVAEPDPTVRA